MPIIDIFYLCDRKVCESCHEVCCHTSDIEHAINRLNLDGKMFEWCECYENADRIGFFEVE